MPCFPLLFWPQPTRGANCSFFEVPAGALLELPSDVDSESTCYTAGMVASIHFAWHEFTCLSAPILGGVLPKVYWHSFPLLFWHFLAQLM